MDAHGFTPSEIMDQFCACQQRIRGDYFLAIHSSKRSGKQAKFFDKKNLSNPVNWCSLVHKWPYLVVNENEVSNIEDMSGKNEDKLMVF